MEIRTDERAGQLGVKDRRERQKNFGRLKFLQFSSRDRYYSIDQRKDRLEENIILHKK